MDLAAARKLEADYNSAAAQVSSAAEKLREEKNAFGKLEIKRRGSIEAFWRELERYFDCVFKDKMTKDPAVAEALGNVIIKWADADTFASHAWYWRYLDFLTPAESILKDSDWKFDGSNFVVISKDYPKLKECELSLYAERILVCFPYLRSRSWDNFIHDKNIIMAFFYRQTGEDAVLATELFRDFVGNSAKNPDYSIEKCSCEGSRAYKGDLYAIALADNSLEEK